MSAAAAAAAGANVDVIDRSLLQTRLDTIDGMYFTHPTLAPRHERNDSPIQDGSMVVVVKIQGDPRSTGLGNLDRLRIVLAGLVFRTRRRGGHGGAAVLVDPKDNAGWNSGAYDGIRQLARHNLGLRRSLGT